MLPDDAQQCNYCGEKLETPVSHPVHDEPQQPVEVADETQQPVEVADETPKAQEPPQQAARKPAASPLPKQKDKRANNNVLYAIIAFLAALLVCGGVLWFMNRGNQSSPDEAATEQVAEAPDAPTGMTDQQAQPQEGVSEYDKSMNEDGPVADEDDTGCTIGRVVVTGSDVRLRTSPEINNHNIITDKRGKNLHPNKGDVLECIDIEGDFYYVYFNDLPCYISKKFATLVE